MPIKLEAIELTKSKLSLPRPIEKSQEVKRIVPTDNNIPVIRCRIDKMDVICHRYICKCGDKGLFMITV